MKLEVLWNFKGTISTITIVNLIGKIISDLRCVAKLSQRTFNKKPKERSIDT
jgi:hypothetical protein